MIYDYYFNVFKILSGVQNLFILQLSVFYLFLGEFLKHIFSLISILGKYFFRNHDKVLNNRNILG